MLVELAIGDAYGAGFEYANEMIKYNDLSHYVQHPRHLKLRPGMYTDDTQMSLAVAELICFFPDEWTPGIIADKFVECFHRDWRDGYARGFQKFLEATKSGSEFLKNIRPESDKSGAAMRAAPIGTIRNTDEVIKKTILQAKLTHDTPDGIEAAVASALLTHFFHLGFYRDGWTQDQVGAWINIVMDGREQFTNHKLIKRRHDWNEEWAGKVKSKGWMSVKAAITAVRHNNKLSNLLKDCVNFTGDTDTVATIALGAAACSDTYKNDLPTVLYNTLENGAFGRDYLAKLDEKLLQ